MVVPGSRRIRASAMLKEQESIVFHTPSAVALASVAVTEGQGVTAGTFIAQLVSLDLDYRLTQAERRIRSLEYERAAEDVAAIFRSRRQAITQELEAAVVEENGDSQGAGSSDPDEPDQWRCHRSLPLLPGPASGSTCASRFWPCAVPARLVADAYVAEDELSRIGLGMTALFVPDGGDAPSRRQLRPLTALRSDP